jgi:hypothetical protein
MPLVREPILAPVMADKVALTTLHQCSLPQRKAGLAVGTGCTQAWEHENGRRL